MLSIRSDQRMGALVPTFLELMTYWAFLPSQPTLTCPGPGLTGTHIKPSTCTYIARYYHLAFFPLGTWDEALGLGPRTARGAQQSIQ